MSDASDVPSTSAPLLKAGSFPPRDDCSELPGWPPFRARLEVAVAKRNADALAALTDPNVDLDFGGGQGIREMRRRLNDKEYRLWDQIATLLPLGCGVQGKGAALPWIHAGAPEEADAYRDMLVLGPAVQAYAKPSVASPAVASLNWALVTVDDYPEPEQPFAKVTLPGGGKTAFIETTKLRSIIDYRLLATREKQGWRITAIIAGD